jgi:hypothetical protein
MSRSAYSTPPGNSPKYTSLDLAFSDRPVLFNGRKCGCGRSVTTWSNSHGCVKPKLLDSWKQIRTVVFAVCHNYSGAHLALFRTLRDYGVSGGLVKNRK